MWGSRFILRTDHQALTTLLHLKGMNRAGTRIARWSTRQMCFQYDIQYRPGNLNIMTDSLSWVPLAATTSDVEPDQDLLEEIAEISPLLTALPLADFKDQCEKCPELTQLRQVITSGWPAVKKSLPVELQLHFLVRHELAVELPLIFRGSHLLLPRSLQGKIVQLAHEGHQGIVRTKQRLRELYWWLCMDFLVHSALLSYNLSVM